MGLVNLRIIENRPIETLNTYNSKVSHFSIGLLSMTHKCMLPTFLVQPGSIVEIKNPTISSKHRNHIHSVWRNCLAKPFKRVKVYRALQINPTP